MNIPSKRLKNGFQLPLYGIGTWYVGGDAGKINHEYDKADINALKTAIDMGVTHIDTAELYARGHAEELIGESIKGYNREKLFITSKVKPENFSYNNLINSAKESIKRMNSKYIDLYLLHSYNPLISIKETMKAMDKLKSDGLVRNIGVSNFSIKTLEKAQNETTNKIVVNQVLYNLTSRFPEDSGLLEYCKKNDIMIIAYTPVHRGIYNNNQIPILDTVAKKYNKTYSQIAINWLVSQDNVVTISKTRNIDHLKENLESLDFKMSNQDIEKLRNNFPHKKTPSFYYSNLYYILMIGGMYIINKI
ncbi:MAG: aldo/keto reductase [Patescibacteria group bacterium]